MCDLRLEIGKVIYGVNTVLKGLTIGWRMEAQQYRDAGILHKGKRTAGERSGAQAEGQLVTFYLKEKPHLKTWMVVQPGNEGQSLAYAKELICELVAMSESPSIAAGRVAGAEWPEGDDEPLDTEKEEELERIAQAAVLTPNFRG